MSNNNSFFEIPIYFCNNDQYSKRIKQQKERSFKDWQNTYKCNGLTNIDDDIYKMVEKNFEKTSPWKYNQIIGFINLFLLGNQFRGEYYLVDNKKLSLNLKNKRIRWCGKFFAEFSIMDRPKEEIISMFLSAVEDGKSHLIFLTNSPAVRPWDEVDSRVLLPHTVKYGSKTT